MDQILQKMRLKDQKPVLVLNAPEEFRRTVEEMPTKPETEIGGRYPFIILFARDLKETRKYAKEVVEAIADDGHLWICYPKGTSKKNISRTRIA